MYPSSRVFMEREVSSAALLFSMTNTHLLTSELELTLVDLLVQTMVREEWE